MNLNHIPVEYTIKVNSNNHFMIILLDVYAEIQLSIRCDSIGTKKIQSPVFILHYKQMFPLVINQKHSQII